MSNDGLGAARADGRLPNDDAVASVIESLVPEDAGDSRRAIDIRVWDGIDLRVLPDRGLDIGAAWFGGRPLAWVSRVGETGPRDTLSGFEWSQGFGGGLMVTCGLRNVGMPSEGHGLHGTYSHLRASDVEVTRVETSGRLAVVVSGRVTDATETPTLELMREITTETGHGRVQVVDTVTNLGPGPADTPVLYHFNFGYPLWGPEARLDADVVETIPRDAHSTAGLDAWRQPPDVIDQPERVLEHTVVPEDGWATATIINQRLGIEVAVSWRVAELPRLHQWTDPSPGMYVLGIEPANCSTLGRAVDRGDGRLPRLGPGESRETALSIEARAL